MSELDAIRRLAARFPAVGDDAAVLDGGLLAAADAIVARVDFYDDTPMADIGWRVVTVNASDIAAMGGRPTAFLLTLVGIADRDLDALLDGVAEACTAYGCELVGGDLSGVPEVGDPLVVSGAILGTTDGRPAVLRSGASAGDAIWVSGPLGASAVSEYRRRPTARVDVGAAIAQLGATAMIDLSDGLGLDLSRLLDASGVGADVDPGLVPRARGADEPDAWNGGDDYELLFTLPDGVAGPGARIGTIVADASQRPLVDGGYVHSL